MAEKLDAFDTKKLRAGENNAVRQWFETYADPLYTLVYYRLAGDGDAAQDVVQETFLTALEKIQEYDPHRGSMFVWLSYLARNFIKKALRERTRSAPHQPDGLAPSGEILDACSQMETRLLPDDILERAETTELVRTALGSIPHDYSDALRQHYCGQVSVEEISKSRGISNGAARALLHRARATFKKEFLRLVKSCEQWAERNTK